MEIEFDDRFRVKSAAGGGGEEAENEPPQPSHIKASERRTADGTP
jgi:hypothetical protein